MFEVEIEQKLENKIKMEDVPIKTFSKNSNSNKFASTILHNNLKIKKSTSLFNIKKIEQIDKPKMYFF